jgi:hypothetical protein
MDEHFFFFFSREISVDIVTRLHVRRAKIRVSIGGKAEDSYRLWTALSLLISRYLGFLGRDSSVGILTHYGLDVPGIESRRRRDFPHPSRPAPGPTQPPI